MAETIGSAPTEVSEAEQAASSLSFNQSLREESRLERRALSPKLSGDEAKKITERLKEVKERKTQLIKSVEETGGLDRADRALRILYSQLEADIDSGQLTKQMALKRLSEAYDRRGNLEEDFGLEPSDPRYGVVGWYYGELLESLEREFESQPGFPTRPLPSPADLAIEEMAAKMDRVIEATAKSAQILEEGAKTEEPGIEKLEVPESPEGYVALVEERLFDLLQKAIKEKKQTKEYSAEYTALSRLIERIPYKGEEHEELSEKLKAEFPEGVFLKEKLTLLNKAMKNLTDRTVEVIVAEG
ncbi:MAG TPA: hypothetical protein VMW25_00440, partial [Clostridia bacterium]|nr:hypothetical protein [Clostridia bacterium]